VASLAHTVLPRTLRTVFLDRDGVLNSKLPEGQFVTSSSEFKLLPGVPEAIAQLNLAGLRVIVISNQRGIALGIYTPSDVREIHTEFQHVLQTQGARVDAFYFCPHDRHQCDCRKPLPGLFHQARADFPDIAAESSAMIGDSWSDIEFGRRLGMFTVYIEGDPETRKPGAEAASELADLRCSSLTEAVNALLGATSR
jgi:D-glycero-D-manno-heptose 1,7-bisphosphate phosphatase